MGTANVMTLYPREEETMGVFAHRLQLAQQFCKEGYHVLGLQEKGEEIGGGSRPERSRNLAR